MEVNQPISRNKVINEFDRRAKLHGNVNAVLDASDKPGIQRQNILRNYLTRKIVLSLLKPSQKDSVLDFGCGIGRLTHYLNPLVGKIAGVDASQAMIELAIQKNLTENPADFCHLNNNVIPFPEGFFDKVFTVWVLQHIGNDEISKIAEEIFRVLKPGGKLILLEQTRLKTAVLSDIHIHRTVQDYIHVFSDAGLHCVLNKPGMRVPSYAMSYWNRFKFLPKFCLPFLYWMESLTVKYKPENIDYFTWTFIFEKK